METRSPSKAAARELPAGTYAVRLVDIRRFVTTFGERIGFELELLEGPHAGAVVLESANRSPAIRGKLADTVAGLTGRPATEAERQGALAALIGTTCRVLLTPATTRSGAAYMQVDKLFP